MFVRIGQQILKAGSAKEVITLFQVLKGELPSSDVKFLSSEFRQNIPDCWSAAATWVEWWLRKSHLRKFCTL